MNANSAEEWNGLWTAEGDDTWRKAALDTTYSRIAKLIPRESKVLDIGGGIGIFGARLERERGCRVTVLEHNRAAVQACGLKRLEAKLYDLEYGLIEDFAALKTDVYVATEVLEHLTAYRRNLLLGAIAASGKQAIFSVPNDRLGPETEPQHTIQWTAITFKRYLQNYFADVRVEVMGPRAEPRNQPAFLVAVCFAERQSRPSVSMTMPVRDEAADIERVLASFSGFVDEIVIGIDPRTVDNTAQLVDKYADRWFYLDELEGPEGDRVPEGGIHFSHARNKCIDACTSEWVFMTEGHEHLAEGKDALLNLHFLPSTAQVAFVLRQGGPAAQRQQWAFPWLFKRSPHIRFRRSTHNTLAYPESYHDVFMPQVKTLHERAHDKELARAAQRKIQNRRTLMEDWKVNDSHYSLFYLASEMREYSTDKAIQLFQEFIATKRSDGAMRYHARLILAKMLWGRGEEAAAREPDPKKAKTLKEECWAQTRDILVQATSDDWSRTEHWLWLGDLMFCADRPGEALQFYRYAASRIADPPATLWWIELSFYSYIPAQRLVMCYAELGRIADALVWAKRVPELFPEDAPSEFFIEAESIIKTLEAHHVED